MAIDVPLPAPDDIRGYHIKPDTQPQITFILCKPRTAYGTR